MLVDNSEVQCKVLLLLHALVEKNKWDQMLLIEIKVEQE